ncbi:UPF0481 protein At3g47200-like [Lolium rigidum]|uniref:UPF0481 protein At3g47200-like n=1 Tax=Lolium rigidum TaxID=89674 RepID=UPI001F5D1107|nr:UPF0481 protein At3g47200-like [Lolium rigidum]
MSTPATEFKKFGGDYHADSSEDLVVGEGSKHAAAEADIVRMEMGGIFDENMWLKATEDFEADFDKMERKMHRFPASLRGLGSRYIVPKVVAIGPYHRGLDHLKEMEKVKQVAAYQFLLSFGTPRPPGTLYKTIRASILSVAGAAHSLYDKDVVAAIGDDEFVDMMILDGIFLLQYMLMTIGRQCLCSSLLRCFHSNQACISNDIMLLENQLPWVVIETLLEFADPALQVEVFIAKMGRTLQVRGDKNREPFEFSRTYWPPHLLGLLRFYKIGGSTRCQRKGYPDVIRPMSKTISVTELAELGIKLTASKTTKLMDMGIKKRPLFSQIFVAPLLLDEMRSCWLVNMAALEICIATDFRWGWDTIQMPVVCSYLAVLAMLMDREEDVHKLRSKRLVQGELTNIEMLNFFKSLIKHISGGPLYTEILEEIEDYRIRWWMLIKVHTFFYKNYKIITAVLSIIGFLVGIFKTLLSLKKHSTIS